MSDEPSPEQDPDELTDERLTAFLESHPPTVQGTDFRLLGFPDEDTARRVGNEAGLWVSMFSRLYPLQGLDGVTYAADYAQALADLERGIPTDTTLTASSESFGFAVAMAPAIKKGGKLKTHVVIAAPLGINLLSEIEEDRQQAIHTLAHELGHVAEHQFIERAFPGVMLAPMSDRYEFNLYAYAHAAFSEYFAERASARFGANVLAEHQELFLGALREMVAKIREARARLNWFDQSTAHPVGEAVLAQVGKTMKFAGYLFGSGDGLDVDPFEGQDEIRNIIAEESLSDWLEELRERQRALFDSREEWKAFDEHFVFNRLFERGCAHYRVMVHRSDEYAIGWRVLFF